MTDDRDFFPALEIRRTRATVERDMAVIDALHAPEYELISPAGRLFRRDEYLALIAQAPFYTGCEAGWPCGPRRPPSRHRHETHSHRRRRRMPAAWTPRHRVRLKAGTKSRRRA